MPGGPEVMVILLVALLVLGPEQLPKAMRTLGSVMAEVRKLSGTFQAEMRQAMDSVEKATSLPTSSSSSSPSSSSSSASTGGLSSASSADSGSGPGASEVVARTPAPSAGTERPPASSADRAAG